MGGLAAGRSEMSTLYPDLMEGFQEILEAQKTGKKMKSTTLSIPDVRHYTNNEIRSIRNQTGRQVIGADRGRWD